MSTQIERMPRGTTPRGEALDASTLRRMVLERIHPRTLGAVKGKGVLVHLDRLYLEEREALARVFEGRVDFRPDESTGEVSALVTTDLAELRPAAKALDEMADAGEAAQALRSLGAELGRSPGRLALAGARHLDLSRGPVVMGILNVTPDSFSDGGAHFDRQRAVDAALRMADEGAGILDIGGESTRPGAKEVALDEELSRVLPVVEALVTRAYPVPISIDTRKAEVARRALAAGAAMVNDVSGLLGDPRMAEVVAEAGAGLAVMHMRGTPANMQEDPVYDDVVGEVLAFLREAVRVAEESGVAPDAISIDPGIGFGKTLDHNLELLARLDEFACLGKPVLVGTSRKSVVGKVLGRPIEERAWGTAATVALAVAAGARILRVHDVAAMADVARMAFAVVDRIEP